MLSTDKQTNQRYQKHSLLCQGGKYGKIHTHLMHIGGRNLIIIIQLVNIDTFDHISY